MHSLQSDRIFVDWLMLHFEVTLQPLITISMIACCSVACVDCWLNEFAMSSVSLFMLSYPDIMLLNRTLGSFLSSPKFAV